MKNDLNIQERIPGLIYVIRGQKIILDSDLAILYDIETKRLNEQVKRNLERFPEDFMFRLSEIEWVDLQSQLATARWGGRRNPPYAFTEHGVAMLSSVLNSSNAIQVNISIVRFFIKMRQWAFDYEKLLKQIDELTGNQKDQSEEIRKIYQIIDHFIQPPA